ncbi:MAG: UDP-N-acetylmuramoyl-L-alanine--D-glutamate ligase [Anaerolineales bacterium]|nr:UDP-N-acetylmuramoyl-L-alanine--D-glutamate ligase [Anaerolineales bacterium]MCB8952333.1 UDP-N-acetylmuramoyl-L-alanine--D-glutamate ligase [Ardenticatenales bacterium]
MDTLTGKHLLILGLARQGMALARFAVSVGAKVTVSDLRLAEQLQANLAALADCPIAYVLGEHPLSLLDGVDVVAVSGSVPASAPIVRVAVERGIPVTNDSQLFAERNPARRTMGITGSAGKTTTTTLTGRLCLASGVTTWVGGNIGQPLIGCLDQIQPQDYVVQELSSFQLEWWRRSPAVAAVLNITPNHLDRHRTMAAYSDAKANILRHQEQDGVAVLCADDPGALALAPLVRGRLRLFSRRQTVTDGAFLRDKQLWLADDGRATPVCALEDIQLRGQHNISNVLAAITLADSVGVPAAVMREAIASFTGVPHRLEPVRVLHGVLYINDSIATAPERALAAINAFHEPLVLLAGGRDKDMVWDDWARTVQQRVKAVVLFGLLAPALADYLAAQSRNGQTPPPVVRCHTLGEAVQAAARLAQPGDVVLLSPGGTSYDAYTDFVARGEHFRQLVRDLC